MRALNSNYYLLVHCRFLQGRMCRRDSNHQPLKGMAIESILAHPNNDPSDPDSSSPSSSPSIPSPPSPESSPGAGNTKGSSESSPAPEGTPCHIYAIMFYELLGDGILY
jgi:hypothetical protein